MDLDSSNIASFLNMLRAIGARKFSGFGISVEFDEAFLGPDSSEPRPDGTKNLAEVVRQVRESGKTIWDDPSLWPAQGGKKLNFDGTLSE